MNRFDKEIDEEKQRALAVVLRHHGIFTYCVDYYHTCHAKCQFHDPYGNGRFIVCFESLRVHACRKTTRGTDPCTPTTDGFNVVCVKSGREILDQNDVDGYSRQFTNPYCRINVPLTQKQRDRPTQLKRLWIVLGDVIHRIFHRRTRETYNRLPGNLARHYVEIIKNLWNEHGQQRLHIGTEVVRIVAKSRFNLHLGHVRVSRLIALENKCRCILERALNTIKLPKKVDFICNHPHESCTYVVRCTLDGFRKNNVVLLDSDEFADLAPMPTEKGINCIFGIRTKEITNCSLILQEALNKLN